MFRPVIASIFILFLFGNCHKEDPEVKISYSVIETSADSPSYNITYTSDKSGGTTIGNSSAATWSSGSIMLKQNQFITMSVDCTAPLFSFTVSVYVNGHLWDQKTLNNPNSSVTISGTP